MNNAAFLSAIRPAKGACCSACAEGKACTGCADEASESGCTTGLCGVGGGRRSVPDASEVFTDEELELLGLDAAPPAAEAFFEKASGRPSRTGRAAGDLFTGERAGSGSGSGGGSGSFSGERAGSGSGSGPFGSDWGQAGSGAFGSTPGSGAFGSTPGGAQFAEREGNADYDLARGLVGQGLGTLRQYLQNESNERIAQIQANASDRAARLTGDRDAEQRILNAMAGARGGNTPVTSSGGSSSSYGGGMVLAALALGLALVGKGRR